MAYRVVKVPVALLLDTDLTASTKVVWMARRVKPAASLADLESEFGLARNTILRAKAEPKHLASPYVWIPSTLVAERRVGAQAKVLYGLLQGLPNFQKAQGEFTYIDLCQFTRLGPNTLKNAMVQLEVAGWVETYQEGRRSPIQFTLINPDHAQGIAEVAAVEQRLRRANAKGEALMKEYLSLLIDSDRFTDNARPGFLVNPLSGERLEFDRFYEPNWAFEFHGEQHDRPTERFAPPEVEAQRLRDLIKAGICLYQGINLVIIRAEDLSLAWISERIGRSLPRRDLAGHESLIDHLERASMAYQAESARARGGARAPQR